MSRSLGRRSEKPYVQITKNGLFLNTINLFEIGKEIRDYQKSEQGTCLSYEQSFIIALYYFYKLNGVSHIDRSGPEDQWRINFYNGDYYQFENDERSFSNSLGNYFKYTGSMEKSSDKDKGLVYWNRFFSEVSLCRIKREMYDFRYNESSIDGISKQAIDTGKLNHVVFDFGKQNRYLE